MAFFEKRGRRRIEKEYWAFDITLIASVLERKLSGTEKKWIDYSCNGVLKLQAVSSVIKICIEKGD